MPIPLQVNATTLPAIIFGTILIATSIGLGVFVWKTRRALDPVVESDDSARQHADNQFRRRIQVSVILFLIGVLIPVGDQLDKLFVQRPTLFFIWVGSVIFLAFWMVLMALGDWLSTMTYSEIAKAHLRNERQVLEQEIRRYHALKNSRAAGDSHSSDG